MAKDSIKQDPFENWTIQVRKGVLELCILNTLEAGEYYGYELVKRVLSIPGLGVSEGTIYPLLARLKAQGLLHTRLVESNAGPARKYYALTVDGRRLVKLMNDYYTALNRGVIKLRKEGNTK